MDGLQVFGRHDVFILYGELVARLAVGHLVSASAYLRACSAVCRRVHFVQTQIAFARHRHAERAVAKHFDAQTFAVRSADVVALDGVVDARHLCQVELARQHKHIGILRVESCSLAV